MATETLLPTSANCTGYTAQDQANPPDTLIFDQLETEFTGGEKSDAAADDTNYVAHSGAYSGFRATFRSTQADTNWTQLDPTFIFRGDGIQWGQAVYLYIWDFDGAQWVQVDLEAAVVASSTDITLTGSISADLTKYGDGSNDIHCCIIISGGGAKMNFYLDLAQIVVTYSAAASSSAGPSSSQASSSPAPSSSLPSASAQPLTTDEIAEEIMKTSLPIHTALPQVKWRTVFATDVTAAALTDRTLSATGPSATDGAFAVRNSTALLAFFGTGADNNQFTGRIYGWRPGITVAAGWQAMVIANLTIDLCASTGVASTMITAGYKLADVIVAANSHASVAAVNPGNALHAFVEVPTLGCPYLELTLAKGNATNVNAIHTEW
jgi:hypothetical protein